MNIPSKQDLHQVYRLDDGTIVPSTTTVISIGNVGGKLDALIGWQRGLMNKGLNPDAVLLEAQQTGTLAHAMIEEYVHEQMGNSGKKVFQEKEYSQETIAKAKNGLESFKAWEESRDIEYEFAERQLVSHKYLYGGTIDLVATINGVKFNVDFKTSRSVYSDHLIQGSAYNELWFENFEERRKTMILRVGKHKSEYQEHVISEEKLKKYFNVFWHLRQVYKYRDLF